MEIHKNLVNLLFICASVAARDFSWKDRYKRDQKNLVRRTVGKLATLSPLVGYKIQ